MKRWHEELALMESRRRIRKKLTENWYWIPDDGEDDQLGRYRKHRVSKSTGGWQCDCWYCTFGREYPRYGRGHRERKIINEQLYESHYRGKNKLNGKAVRCQHRVVVRNGSEGRFGAAWRCEYCSKHFRNLDDQQIIQFPDRKIWASQFEKSVQKKWDKMWG